MNKDDLLVFLTLISAMAATPLAMWIAALLDERRAALQLDQKFRDLIEVERLLK